jgi:hypothetical protein
MKPKPLVLLALVAIFALTQNVLGQSTPMASPTPPCPGFGWAEGLVKYTAYPAPPFPTNDTQNVNAQDCAFH